MPYRIVKKGNKWLTVNKQTGKVKGTHSSKHKAVAQMRLLYGIESGKFRPTGGKGRPFRVQRAKRAMEKAKYIKKKDKISWQRKVDIKMRGKAGEIDYEKKLIRINPEKEELLDTILHEEFHKKYPTKSEKWIKNKVDKVEQKLTIKKAISLLTKYKKSNKAMKKATFK